MAIVYSRALGKPENILCGQYTRNTDGAAIIKCGLCGHLFDKPAGLYVALDGACSPRLKCPACPFLEFVVLSDYWLTEDECR